MVNDYSNISMEEFMDAYGTLDGGQTRKEENRKRIMALLALGVIMLIALKVIK